MAPKDRTERPTAVPRKRDAIIFAGMLALVSAVVLPCWWWAWAGIFHSVVPTLSLKLLWAGILALPLRPEIWLPAISGTFIAGLIFYPKSQPRSDRFKQSIKNAICVPLIALPIAVLVFVVSDPFLAREVSVVRHVGPVLPLFFGLISSPVFLGIPFAIVSGLWTWLFLALFNRDGDRT